MKLDEPKVRAEIRSRGRCEGCQRPGPVDCHHIFGKGAGQVDTRGNLIALCRICHGLAGGEEAREKFLKITAEREFTTVSEIKRVVMLIRRLPKETPDAEVPTPRVRAAKVRRAGRRPTDDHRSAGPSEDVHGDEAGPGPGYWDPSAEADEAGWGEI